MIVPKKLNSSELNGLEQILPKLEQDNMLEVSKTNYTFINRQNHVTQKSNPKLEKTKKKQN